MQTEKTGFDQETVRGLEEAATKDGKQLTRKFYTDNDAARLRSAPWPDRGPIIDYKELWQTEAQIRARLAAENAQLRGCVQERDEVIAARVDQSARIRTLEHDTKTQLGLINVLRAQIQAMQQIPGSKMAEIFMHQFGKEATAYIDLLLHTNKERDELINKLIKSSPHYYQKG